MAIQKHLTPVLAGISLAVILSACSSGTAPLTDTSTTSPTATESVQLNAQQGTVRPAEAGEATYPVYTTNVPNGTAGVVAWYSDSAGSTAASAPEGVTASITAVSSGYAFLTLSTGLNAVPGTYYFRLTEDTAVSAVTALTVSGLSGVFVGGFTMSPQTGGYWADGTWQALPKPSSGETLVSCLSYSGSTLYAGGRAYNASGVRVAGYWANGVWTALPNPYSTAKDAEVTSILVSGTNVYAGGYCANSSDVKIAGYWVNGVWTGLTNDYGSYDASVKAISVSGTSVYAGGNCMSSSSIKVAGYWVDGTWNALPNKYGSYYEELAGFAVSGSTVYAAGYCYTGASSSTTTIQRWCVWVGGVQYVLSNDGYTHSIEELTSLAFSGSTLYAGGYYAYGGTIYSGYFSVDLSNIAGNSWWHVCNSTYNHSWAEGGIALAGSTVYLAGRCMNSSDASFWGGYWYASGGLWQSLSPVGTFTDSILVISD